MLVFIAGASKTRRLGGQNDGGKQIVGHARGKARDGVGRGGRDDDQIRAAGQLDVANTHPR
jgi:hypothetical protein